MKRIVTLLMVLLLLAGCSSNVGAPEEVAEPEKEPEPIGYYGPLYLESTEERNLETLKDGKIILQSGYGSEYNEYIKEYLSEYGVEEDNYVYVDSYKAVPEYTNNEDTAAWIMDPELEDIVMDFRPDYKADDYVVIEEILIPYYEEKEANNSVINDPLYTDPFVFFISGIDENVDPATMNGVRTDVNIVMVVVPELKHVLTVSFPRDSYVKSVKGNYYSKLNALISNGGTENTANSLGELLEVDIDQYVQESFSSFVDMINLIGGLWVDVPMNVHLDQDSTRNVANPFDISKGVHHLYGEQALAIARNRKYNGLVGGDFGRIRNQILLVNELINKFANNPKLFDMISMSWLYKLMISTNYTDEQMQVLIALAKTFAEGYTIDNYFISCYDDHAGDAYIARIYSSSLAIAKGKIKLAMTGEIDPDSKYYDDILTGYVSKGAGTSKDGGYLGDEYDLREVFGITEEASEEE